jgi:lipopolysaccharide biosynthesis glycosyltransferase
MKDIVAFSIADDNNMPYFEKFKASLNHFHPELELRLFGPNDLARVLPQDPEFFYRATPAIARDLLKDYKTVIKIDADSIITGDISHTWEGEFDVATVNNTNPRDHKKYLEKTGQQVSVWNIHPFSYQNCGFVVMKSPQFVEHWWALCTSPHFDAYQYKEQDLLNIMIFYGMYGVKFLDNSDKFHGLVTKGYEIDMVLKENKLILPANDELNSQDKQVVVWHAGGGNTPNKMNTNLIFREEIAEWLNKLTKES